ncbi:MAG TPA: hypothetical protein VNE63_18335, partial [Candidatus Acidoferrales bacterium]|nr:hypothetical protein [Candidatus Acidoferrales bacterium]
EGTNREHPEGCEDEAHYAFGDWTGLEVWITRARIDACGMDRRSCCGYLRPAAAEESQSKINAIQW